MQVTVFGANGKVGSLVVEHLLRRGHSVVAFVHGAHKFSENKNLHIFSGDIYSSSDVSQALHKTDMVVSTLGSWGTPNKNVLSEGMKNIIPAMKDKKIKRIVSLTGADARAENDDMSLIHRLTYFSINLLAKKILQDGECHIELLQKSGLEWTVLRSPIMNERGSLSFKITNDRPSPWSTVHRHSVALSMVNQLEDKTYVRQSPYIVRSK